MPYFPIFFDIAGRRCVVIGGGEIAARKIAQLLEAGAAVTIVSPELTDELSALRDANRIAHLARRWRRGDLHGFALAFAATGNREVNREIAAEAHAEGVLLNVADEPALCDFVAPAVVRRGDLQIAVSTSGASPAMAARIRRELELTYGAEYAAALVILRAAREHLRRVDPDAASRARRLKALAESRLVDVLRGGDREQVERLLIAQLGAGADCLGVDVDRLFSSASAPLPG